VVFLGLSVFVSSEEGEEGRRDGREGRGWMR